MLINLRNALMTGKRLPYDNEIEFLESTGTQYIDTGLDYFADFEITAKLRTSVPNVTLYAGNANRFERINATFPNWRFCSDAGGIYDTTVPIIELHTLAWRNGKVYSDGVEITTHAKNFPADRMYVFGFPVAQYPAMVYALKLWDANGVLVRDFIPVRVGQVGYLYDRVSGKLFGNAGTGDFVLGPDVVPVEYIESHGTEWIETGVSAVSSPKYSMKIRCSFTTPTSPTVQYWGADNGGTYGLNSGDFLWSGGVSAVAGRVYDIFYQNAGVVRYGEVDGVRYTGSNFASSGYRCLLFCAGQSGTRKTALFAARLYGAEFVSADNLAFKSVPIRVGTDATSWEGAMMDVLTRRIYRNQGTGAFTYGNDLKYPIPAE